MATTPVQPDPATRVKVTTRLWSEQVALADAGQIPAKDKAYEFSNGRTFEQPTNPYTGTTT